MNLYRLNEPQPGLSISWALVTNNSGDSSYDGGIECLFDGESIFFENASIPISGSNNMSVSMISKPGVLVCTSSGARTSSTTNATDAVAMTSAIFLGAGHSSPSLLGGPWHAGDEVTLSMLLRNEGDAVGSASMRVSINGDLQNGTSTTLEGGKAGEVNHKFSFASSGDKIVNWSVVSLDGAVDSNLSGSMTIPVLPSQVIKMDIESVSLSAVANTGYINWYTTSTGGTPVGSSIDGQNFIVNPTQTTTYYAEKVSARRDSIINYTETNPDSLDPYKLTMTENGSYTEFDIDNNPVEGGTWSVSGNQLTLNSPDTILVLTVNSVDRDNVSLSLNFNETESEMGMEINYNITSTVNSVREW